MLDAVDDECHRLGGANGDVGAVDKLVGDRRRHEVLRGGLVTDGLERIAHGGGHGGQLGVGAVDVEGDRLGIPHGKDTTRNDGGENAACGDLHRAGVGRIVDPLTHPCRTV